MEHNFLRLMEKIFLARKVIFHNNYQNFQQFDNVEWCKKYELYAGDRKLNQFRMDLRVN